MPNGEAFLIAPSVVASDVAGIRAALRAVFESANASCASSAMTKPIATVDNTPACILLTTPPPYLRRIPPVPADDLHPIGTSPGQQNTRPFTGLAPAGVASRGGVAPPISDGVARPSRGGSAHRDRQRLVPRAALAPGRGVRHAQDAARPVRRTARQRGAQRPRHVRRELEPQAHPPRA